MSPCVKASDDEGAFWVADFEGVAWLEPHDILGVMSDVIRQREGLAFLPVVQGGGVCDETLWHKFFLLQQGVAVVFCVKSMFDAMWFLPIAGLKCENVRIMRLVVQNIALMCNISCGIWYCSYSQG